MLRAPRYSPATERILDFFQAAPRRWIHGYTLLTELDLTSGTLYPILLRLSDLGWLVTRWELPAEGGRPRHLYRLADGAATEARALLRIWQARRISRASPRYGTR
jgi:DNA-binding PadR family transcriptional regulator